MWQQQRVLVATGPGEIPACQALSVCFIPAHCCCFGETAAARSNLGALKALLLPAAALLPVQGAVVLFANIILADRVDRLRYPHAGGWRHQIKRIYGIGVVSRCLPHEIPEVAQNPGVF